MTHRGGPADTVPGGATPDHYRSTSVAPKPTSKLYLDIETYSTQDIRSVNVYRYSEDPQFRILMAAWSVDGGPVQVVTTEEDIATIPGLRDPAVLKVAHNAQFERVCFSRLLGLPTGSYLPPEQWHDTMAVAGEQGYPQRLGPLAVALGAPPKDEAGTRLINYFCKPNRARGRNLPGDAPEEWAEFVAYCRQDVETLVAVDKALGPLPTEMERRVWLADQHINDHGMAVDLNLAQHAMEAAEDNRMEQELEVMALTGVANPGSGPQLLEWLRGPGQLPLANLQAATVEQALARDLPPTTRRVLELRQELALVASKKFSSAIDSVGSDGRLRGSLRFFGAHTGRWAGRGTQPHNMPRAQLDDDTATEAAIVDLRLGLGADAFTLKALVRSMFTGPMVVVDYAAIEARVLAWLAGEEWALDAFRAGRDIYVETAERMGGLTRSQGKVAVLALGYNGGVNSLRAMGGEGSDEFLQRMVTQWRAANLKIVDMWSQLGNAFRFGGHAGAPGRLWVETGDKTRRLRLPSGRAIHYHGCRWEYKTNKWGNKSWQASFADPKRAGLREDTYGGRLTENVTQAVARDVLAEALVRLRDAGYTVLGHVHDEILVEGTDVAGVQAIMTEPPAWAEGLPIDGEGFTTLRYRKG